MTSLTSLGLPHQHLSHGKTYWKGDMIPNDADIQRRRNAENALAHLKDQERLIAAKEVEARRLLVPIRQRKVQNHFLDEARELLDRRRRGE